MSTGIGMVSQGEFMSSKSLVEAARIVLSAAPHGLSEEMLVHVLLLDDRPFIGLGAHVYGARSKSRNALGNKGLAALRRTKGMSKRDGRWFYDGPLPSGDKVADDAAVVRDTPSSRPGTRCCKGCGAILRRGNDGDRCWPCDPVEKDETRLRPIVPPSEREKRGKKRGEWTREQVAREIVKWAKKHGRVPASHDWQMARRRGETRPSRNLVINLFGTWNAAIEAAGFTPKPKPVGERKGSDTWYALMRILPDTSRGAADTIGRPVPATFDVLKRMEASGWVYRERLPPKEGFGPGGDRYLWHPMPQGMEAAA